MAEKTKNYNLTKPSEDDFYDINVFNENADIIDTKFKETSDKIQKTSNRINDVNLHSVYKLNKDENGIYTEVQFKRLDGTLYMKSVLSGGTSPNYSTRTITEYDENGITIANSKTFTIIYDSDNNVVSEVVQ